MPSLPTLSVELGRLTGWVLGESLLGVDTNLATYEYTDITSRVTSASIRRGRQHELDRIEAGVASLNLINQDGAFNAANTSSVYYPDIRPMVPLRIRANFVGFTPSAIAGLVAWYDFSDATTLWKDTARTSPVTADADVIKGVTDKSGVGNHLSEATNGPAYKTAIINGHSVARFDGTNDTLAKNPTVGTTAQPLTIFLSGVFVAPATNDAYVDSAAANRFIPLTLDFPSGLHYASYYGSTVIVSGIAANTNAHVFEADANGASSALRVDGGANIISGNPGASSSAAIVLANNAAAGGGDFAQLDIMHVLFYSGTLSNADKDLVGQYLASAAGITWTAVS